LLDRPAQTGMAMLLGAIPRMGIPLTAAVGSLLHARLVAEASRFDYLMVSYLILFYPVTLAAEAYVLLRP
jgi:hypothetical protein